MTAYRRPPRELTAAYRGHIHERLAAVRAPELHVAKLDTTHAMLDESPTAVGELIIDFLGATA